MMSVESNSANLLSLWKTVSLLFETYHEEEDYAFCSIPASQWPNRVWAKQPVSDGILTKIINTIKVNETGLTFSYFDEGDERGTKMISDKGFKEKFVQYGMSKVLDHPFEIPERLDLRLVSNKEECRLWCQAFKQSFGYEIIEETLYRSHRNINFFNIMHQHEVVGTVIIHLTDKVAGIHSLGIIPQMRGKGFARKAMHLVLNLAMEKGAMLATLQASEAAKEMYESLGFSTHFFMRNYQLNSV